MKRPGTTALPLVRRAQPDLAGAQAAWIAAMEPWRGLGYDADRLETYLRQAAASGHAWVASLASVARPTARKLTLGLLVLQPNVLLGNFVALLAVQPAAAGQGIGRALMARAQAETFATRRWLFVSADATNVDALGFYRHLGFARVGRLPNLVREGRTELLLRQGHLKTTKDKAPS